MLPLHYTPILSLMICSLLILVDQQFRLEKGSGGAFFTRKSLSLKARGAKLEAELNDLCVLIETTSV